MVLNSHVLLLNGIVVNESDLAAINSLLEGIINTLQISKAAIDPEALADSLNKPK